MLQVFYIHATEKRRKDILFKLWSNMEASPSNAEKGVEPGTDGGKLF